MAKNFKRKVKPKDEIAHLRSRVEKLKARRDEAEDQFDAVSKAGQIMAALLSTVSSVLQASSDSGQAIPVDVARDLEEGLDQGKQWVGWALEGRVATVFSSASGGLHIARYADDDEIEVMGDNTSMTQEEFEAMKEKGEQSCH